MRIQFDLNTGKSITADIPNFDSAEFANQLNDQSVLFVTIGNNGFQKHTLLTWSEVESTIPAK